jgi:V/A-type H+-transporting ATPase subunit I
MEKISAALLGADARAALRLLGGLGAVQLLPPEAKPDTGPAAARENAAARARWQSLVARLEVLKREFGAVPGTGGKAAALRGFGETEAALAAAEEEAGPVIETRRAAREARAAAASRRERLAAYAALPLPSGRLDDFSFLRCFTGSLPSGGLDGFPAAPGNWLVSVLGTGGGRTTVLGLAHRDSAPALASALKAAGFRAEELPSRRGLTLEEAAAYFSAEEKRSGLAVLRAERGLAGLAKKYSAALSGVARAAAAEERLLAAESCLGAAGSAVVFSGWVPAPEAGAVTSALAAATGGRFAAETEMAGGKAPVLLRPPAWLKPFTGLVKAYGLPGYKEVDPTAFAAIIYVLLFGFMFGDAGHGAVVCAGGLWLALRGPAAVRAAGRVAAWCGLSGIVFGFVYGSFFGLESFKKYALWRDPLAGDPLAMVLAALAAGAAVISLGVALNIVNRARSGDVPGALLGRFGGAGLLFYWSALLMAAGKLGPGLGVPALAAALACWALHEPLEYLAGRASGGKSEGWLEVWAGAVVGTFEGVLLYLANTVSFARLAAYAISHAALLASSYMLAASADKIWGPGSLPGVLLAIAGNGAAVLLEGTVAAVQALRLEYYEFFGKFLEGNGSPFTPFTIETEEIK